MTSDVTTLKPGLLVSLKTGIDGNIRYDRQDIEADHLTERGTKEAEWQTRRVIDDPDEYEAGNKVRGVAITAVRRVCVRSSFGLLCPEAKEDELNVAIAGARTLVNEFNRRAQITGVKFYVMVGRVASDDVEAVRAIKGEIRDLIKTMQDGIKAANVTAIRDAANRAKGVGRMLSEEAQARVQDAVDMARAAAKVIVKAGDDAAVEIDTATIRKLGKARVSFLDIEEDGEASAPVQTAAAKGRVLDISEDEEPTVPTPPARPARYVRPDPAL